MIKILFSLKNYFLILFVFLLFKFSFAQNSKPNFIIIFADDLGYGNLGIFGNPEIKTPNLDALVMEGQKWTNFYVADPVCTPSRAALLTGKYPIRSGMTSKHRAVLFPDSANGLPEKEITIAEILKLNGYKTTMIGKWHLGHLPKFLPTKQGFDTFYGIPYSNDMNGNQKARLKYKKGRDDPFFQPDFKNYNVPLIENEKIIERPANQNLITKRYTEKTIEFIQKNKSSPFFIYLAHSMPHIPLFSSKNKKNFLVIILQ